jgi:hypothetical protein
MSRDRDRDGILGALQRFSRGRSAQPVRPEGQTAYPIPPSRRNRKPLTTWQEAVALRHLKEISVETGLSQQMLIAEGNHVLQKYGKPSMFFVESTQYG